MYREMLSVVAKLERAKIDAKIATEVVYSLQVDVSMNRQQQDNKCVTARVVDANAELQNNILSVVEPQGDGTNVLLEAVKTAVEGRDLPLDKLVGLTTDGESANTGRSSGLWKRPNDVLGRDLISIWCVGHKGDPALESVEKTVSEILHWKTNLCAVITHFRTSKSRNKKLRESSEKVVTFPQHFEVRFAQHLLSSINAVLTNLAACREVWQETAAKDSKKEKAEAKGFIKTWAAGGRAVRVTSVMPDICGIVCHPQNKIPTR
ncbi:uncharacterized protein LOC119090483, partial [Pollicipes pollicipes]|uniref:uncharacterized protein LOC119090483 n=1 Tax=Pollicipes pollicipes TaxID=41117 RepID=UPI00188562C4